MTVLNRCGISTDDNSPSVLNPHKIGKAFQDIWQSKLSSKKFGKKGWRASGWWRAYISKIQLLLNDWWWRAVRGQRNTANCNSFSFELGRRALLLTPKHNTLYFQYSLLRAYKKCPKISLKKLEKIQQKLTLPTQSDLRFGYIFSRKVATYTAIRNKIIKRTKNYSSFSSFAGPSMKHCEPHGIYMADAEGGCFVCCFHC